MQRRDRQSCGAIRANEVANWAFDAQVEKSKLWWIFVPRYQSGACSSNDVKQQGGQINLVVCVYPELYDTTSYFYKNRNIFCNETGAAWQKPSHDANSRLLCSEFHARMKRINSNCSSVQLRAIYSLHSRLVWTHLEADTIRISIANDTIH